MVHIKHYILRQILLVFTLSEGSLSWQMACDGISPGGRHVHLVHQSSCCCTPAAAVLAATTSTATTHGRYVDTGMLDARCSPLKRRPASYQQLLSREVLCSGGGGLYQTARRVSLPLSRSPTLDTQKKRAN